MSCYTPLLFLITHSKRADYGTTKEILTRAIDGSIKAFVTLSIVRICGNWLTKAYSQNKAKRLMLAVLADVASTDISHETTPAT